MRRRRLWLFFGRHSLPNQIEIHLSGFLKLLNQLLGLKQGNFVPELSFLHHAAITLFEILVNGISPFFDGLS